MSEIKSDTVKGPLGSDSAGRGKRVRAHGGTLADASFDRTALILRVIGQRPENQPYLSIYEVGDGPVCASVVNANALRGLAHAILRALGDEPPTTPAKKQSR